MTAQSWQERRNERKQADQARKEAHAKQRNTR
jgi:hypothetical protein